MAGWSLGGMVAQAMITQYSDLVCQAILIGTSPPIKSNGVSEKLFWETALKPITDLDDGIVLFFEPQSESSKNAAKLSFGRIAKRTEDMKICFLARFGNVSGISGTIGRNSTLLGRYEPGAGECLLQYWLHLNNQLPWPFLHKTHRLFKPSQQNLPTRWCEIWDPLCQKGLLQVCGKTAGSHHALKPCHAYSVMKLLGQENTKKHVRVVSMF
jgi:pimeloyl-ACP methyl ester carboxylesterase